MLLDDPLDLGYGAISGGSAVEVVDLLKAVHVAEDQGEGTLIAFRPLDLEVENLLSDSPAQRPAQAAAARSAGRRRPSAVDKGRHTEGQDQHEG